MTWVPVIAVLYPLIWLGLLVLILESVWQVHSDIQKLRRELMTTGEQIQTALARINAAVTNIADDIRRLANEHDPDALSRDAALALKDNLVTLADQLEGIAAITPEPEGGSPTTESEPTLPFEGEAEEPAHTTKKKKH